MKSINILLVGVLFMALNGAMSPVQAGKDTMPDYSNMYGGYTPQTPSQSTKKAPPSQPAKGPVKPTDPNYVTVGKDGKYNGTLKSQRAGTQPTD